MNERAHYFSVNSETYDNSSISPPTQLQSSMLISSSIISTQVTDSIPLMDLPPAYFDIIKENVDVKPPPYISHLYSNNQAEWENTFAQ